MLHCSKQTYIFTLRNGIASYKSKKVALNMTKDHALKHNSIRVPLKVEQYKNKCYSLLHLHSTNLFCRVRKQHLLCICLQVIIAYKFEKAPQWIHKTYYNFHYIFSSLLVELQPWMWLWHLKPSCHPQMLQPSNQNQRVTKLLQMIPPSSIQTSTLTLMM